METETQPAAMEDEICGGTRGGRGAQESRTPIFADGEKAHFRG